MSARQSAATKAERRAPTRARHRLFVRVAAEIARQSEVDLADAASRFATAREAAKRSRAHLFLVIADAKKAGAL